MATLAAADLRAVSLERCPACRRVWPMFWQLPASLTRLQYGIFCRWLIEGVRHPRVPSRLHLCRVIFLVGVIDPSCTHCKSSVARYRVRVAVVTVMLHKEVTVLSVRGNSSSRFSKYLLPYRSDPIYVPALVSPMYCIWWPKSLMPILRRLRSVRRIVDMTETNKPSAQAN